MMIKIPLDFVYQGHWEKNQPTIDILEEVSGVRKHGW